MADDIEGTGGARWVKSIVSIDGVEIPCVEELDDMVGGFWIYMFNAKDLYRIAEGKKLKPDAEFLDTLGLLKTDKDKDLFENFK